MCGPHLSHHTHHSHPEPMHPDDRQAESQVRMQPCPHCGTAVQEDFVFCPRCGAEILTACPSCHRAVQSDWTHCPYCGIDLLAGKAGAAPHSHT